MAKNEKLGSQATETFQHGDFPAFKIVICFVFFFIEFWVGRVKKETLKKKHKKSANRSIAVEPGKRHLNMDDARIV